MIEEIQVEVRHRRSDEAHQPATLVLSSDAGCAIRVDLPGDASIEVSDHTDFDAAAIELWHELDKRELLLGINRFRKNAYSSSVSIGMSDGRGCYLIKPKRPVQPDDIVDAFAVASVSDAVSFDENAAFVERWTARPPLLWRVRSRLRDWF